jgi:hypothetical protein
MTRLSTVGFTVTAGLAVGVGCDSTSEQGSYSIQEVRALESDQASAWHSGLAIERRVHVFYRKEPAKPGTTKPQTSVCHALMAAGARWKTTEAYVLDPTNLNGLEPVWIASVVQQSLDTWDGASASAIFGPRDTTALADGVDTVTPDGKNEVLFGSIADAGVLAVTIVWGVFSGPPSQRVLVEWDALFNDAGFAWGNAGLTSETAIGNPAVFDVQNVATHEFGHSLGLTHPPDSCLEETMYRFAGAGETKKRTLHAGDLSGLAALYP